MEESCWDLFKSYCELLGVELVPDNDDEDAISFDIAKGIQDHIIDLFLKAGVKMNFDPNQEVS